MWHLAVLLHASSANRNKKNKLLRYITITETTMSEFRGEHSDQEAISLERELNLRSYSKFDRMHLRCELKHAWDDENTRTAKCMRQQTPTAKIKDCKIGKIWNKTLKVEMGYAWTNQRGKECRRKVIRKPVMFVYLKTLNLFYLFRPKHQQQREQAAYMPMKSITMNIGMYAHIDNKSSSPI